MLKIATLLSLLAFAAFATPARADLNLDDLAPKLTKCWSSTCVMPDAAVNAALFDISAKKWQVGTTSLGAGIALLFVADSPYASGLTAHLTGVLTQTTGQSSFAMPTIGLVLMRYFEVGYSYRLSSNEPNASYISVAGNIPWDVFTAATLPQRMARARAAERAQPGDDLTAGKR
jgi:hypothetical protein